MQKICLDFVSHTIEVQLVAVGFAIYVLVKVTGLIGVQFGHCNLRVIKKIDDREAGVQFA